MEDSAVNLWAMCKLLRSRTISGISAASILIVGIPQLCGLCTGYGARSLSVSLGIQVVLLSSVCVQEVSLEYFL